MRDSDNPLPRPGAGFADALLLWFARAQRPLPWRRDCGAYRVWISEIMLQQTQMDRGVAYFNKWMRRFPDIRSVAAAGEDAILAAWEGLGYYSRARNLHRAAKVIMEKHGGVFPPAFADIRALPGVGEYTAGAISCIAFNNPYPAVDANVLRVFSRVCDIADSVALAETRRRVTELVRAVTPEGRARGFCQALMELGALVCGKVPRCGECPVRDFCEALRRGTAGERPVKGAAAEYRRLVTAAVVVERAGRVFLRRRPPGGMWAGLWEFPGGEVDSGENPEDALVRHVAGLAGAGEPERIGTVRHGYTVWRVTLHGFLLRLDGGAAFDPPGGGVWVKKNALGEYAFPSGHAKLLRLLGWK